MAIYTKAVKFFMDGDEGRGGEIFKLVFQSLFKILHDCILNLGLSSIKILRIFSQNGVRRDIKHILFRPRKMKLY